MFTIEETNEMLDEIVDTLPQPLFVSSAAEL